MTIEQVRETAMKLEKHHRNVNISRIAGSAVSTGGIAAVIAGFALAPVTLRGSLALLLIGAGASAVGGVAAVGASIADTAIQKDSLKKIQKQIDYDNLQVEVIRQMAKKIDRIQASIQVGSAAAIAMQAVTGAVQIDNAGIKAAELATFTCTSKEISTAVLRVGGVATISVTEVIALCLSIVMIPIDLAEILRSGDNLRKGSQTEAVEKLNTLAVQLEEQMESIKNKTKIDE